VRTYLFIYLVIILTVILNEYFQTRTLVQILGGGLTKINHEPIILLLFIYTTVRYFKVLKLLYYNYIYVKVFI